MGRQSIKRASEIPTHTKVVVAALATLAGVIGLSQAIGWWLRRPEFFAPWPGTAVMSIHTATAIMMGSTGVGLTLLRNTSKAALLMGSSLFAIGSLSFFKGAFGVGFTLNDWAHAAEQALQLSASTSVYTSIALLLISVALISQVVPLTRRAPIQVAIASAAASAIGYTGILSYLLHIIPSAASSTLGALAFSTALALALLGTALLLIEIKRYQHSDYWVPAMVGTLGFVTTLVMWQALDAVEDIGEIFPYVFLSTGVLLALLASISAYSALVARKHLNLARVKERELLELNSILEAKVRERTQELAHSNAELERFASMAAHDLKSPLNSMTQFADLLSEELDARLSPDERQYLAIISRAGERARRMIDSLLLYAKAGSRPPSFEVLDAGLIAREAEENLHFDAKASKADIAIQQLPSICGDRIELTQLFQNLLANAIKFHKRGQQPRIRVTAEDDDKAWRFSVADNGIGMDPKHSAKVFEIFSRLHSEEEYPA